MKINYRPLIKGTNWALVGILGLLGFSGCEKIVNGNDEVMYGVPWASKAIKGAVVNKADGKPIEGIRIDLVTDNIEWLEGQKKESWVATTDAKGEFKLSDTLVETIAITDIDGEKNGSFASDTLKVSFDKAEIIGGRGGWFQGELTATVKVELKEKKANE
jgi:putative lipoprotein (rSAM/lipoprotein system)